jgi:hypothetical protein
MSVKIVAVVVAILAPTSHVAHNNHFVMNAAARGS